MNDVDDNVLDCIFRKCTTKTLARLQCTCRRFRDISRYVGSTRGIQLSCTPYTFDRRIEWATSDKDRADRVFKFVSYRVPLWRIPLHSLENLETVSIRRVRVHYRNIWKLDCLPKLKNLDIHRLTRGLEEPDRFLVSTLPSSLERVSLVFDDMWNAVVVNDCSAIKHLSIRCIRGLYLRQCYILVHALGDLETLVLRGSDRVGVHLLPDTQSPIRKLVVESPSSTFAGHFLRMVGPHTSSVEMILPRVRELHWTLPLVRKMVLQAYSVVLETENPGALEVLVAYARWITLSHPLTRAKTYFVGTVIHGLG